MMTRFTTRTVWIFFLFLGGGFLLYGTALDSVMTYDDVHQIVQNPSIRTLDNVPSMFVDVSTASKRLAAAKHYRPLLLSTFSLNYALGEFNPVGYHLVNLAFHIGSSFLVFLILRSLLYRDTARDLPAVAAGLVMLAHPFNTEVVNYITARSSVMATFFYLLAFYAYLRYRPPQRGEEGTTPDVGSRIWLYLSISAFALGLLTKEILITFPIIVFLYEIILRPSPVGTWRKVTLPAILFGGMGLAYLLVRKLAVGQIAPSEVARGFWENLAIQIKALAITWRMLILPTHLSIEHPTPTFQSLGDGTFWGAALFLVVLLISMVWLSRSPQWSFRVIGFFLAWFHLTLLPTLLVPLHAVIQENRGYIAAAAFAGILGGIIHRVNEKGPAPARLLIRPLLGGVLILFTLGVWERNQVWGNEITLWEDAVRKSPDAYGPHFGLASAYTNQKEWVKAEAEYLKALRIDNTQALLHNDLASLYAETGRPEEAIRQYKEAIRVNPKFALPYNNLGLVYKQMGQFQDALEMFKMAVRLNPVHETALVHLGTFYQESRPEKAMALYNYALSLNPNLPEVLLEVGLLQQKRGDYTAAVLSFQKAITLDPDAIEAYIALGQAYLTLGRPQEAISTLEEALSLRPEEGIGYLTLGKLYEQMGDRDSAVAYYQKTLILNPQVNQNEEAIIQARQELKRIQGFP